jgi:hypothetical protein
MGRCISTFNWLTAPAGFVLLCSRCLDLSSSISSKDDKGQFTVAGANRSSSAKQHKDITLGTKLLKLGMNQWIAGCRSAAMHARDKETVELLGHSYGLLLVAMFTAGACSTVVLARLMPGQMMRCLSEAYGVCNGVCMVHSS